MTRKKRNERYWKGQMTVLLAATTGVLTFLIFHYFTGVDMWTEAAVSMLGGAVTHQLVSARWKHD